LRPVTVINEKQLSVPEVNTPVIKSIEQLQNDIKEIKSPHIQSTAGNTVSNSKGELEIYGFVRMDASYDDSRAYPGNYVLCVESEVTGEDDNIFNMTANITRLGMNFKGAEMYPMETSGKLETDFYGGGSENAPNIRIRQAYMKLNWPDKDCSLLFGQAWDVISPLNPSTVNFGAQWWAGNIGSRHPQIRFTKGMGVEKRVEWQMAVSRTIGDAWGDSPGDTGEDAGFPTLQTRIGFTMPSGTGGKFGMGLSGHWGKEEYDNAGTTQDFETWSANVDLQIPIARKFMLKAEGFAGTNMDNYYGGIGQGVNQTLLDTVGGFGWWGALSMGPFGKTKINIGASMDDPNDQDLNNGDRSLNTAYFGNINCSLSESTSVAFEISFWETEYKNAPSGDDVRFHLATTYKF